MAQRKRIKFGGEYSDIITGYSLGKYPLHHFITFKSAGIEEVPMSIVTAGIDEWVPGCFRKRENSSIYALEYVTEGVFRFVQNNNSYDLVPGELFIVQRYRDATMECLSSRGSKIAIVLDGILLHQIINALGLTKVDVIKNGDRQLLDELFSSASGWCQNGDLIGNASFTYRLLLELSMLVRNVKKSPKLQTAVTFLRANLTRHVNIKEICAHCRISKPTLYRFFNEEKQCSPLEYHERLRLKYAGEVLLRVHNSVKMVSYLLGFSSPQYFATRFRKYYHCSPSAIATGKMTVHCNQDQIT